MDSKVGIQTLMMVLILVRTQASSENVRKNGISYQRIKSFTKSPGRLEGNGPKHKNAAAGANHPGHIWPLC